MPVQRARRPSRCLRAVTCEVDGTNSGNPSGVRRARARTNRPMAILSRAGGAPPEGAETTWGLRERAPRERSGRSASALDHRRERPAPDRRVRHGASSVVRGEGEEIVHSHGKSWGQVNPLVLGSNPSGPIPSGAHLDPASRAPGRCSRHRRARTLGPCAPPDRTHAAGQPVPRCRSRSARSPRTLLRRAAQTRRPPCRCSAPVARNSPAIGRAAAI